jgi:Lrp/AsnC family transcriptional regulator for asnA, asnC and gidA
MTNLDELDQDIVKLLQEDGRLSNTDIAKRVGVSEATVRRRIAKLEKDDMVRVVAITNPFKVGSGIMAFMGLQVENSCLRQVERALVDLPETRFVGVMLGGYDIIIEVWFETNEDLFEFMADTIGSIDGIQRSETFQIMRLSKYCYKWKGEPAARLEFKNE